jgi:LmbE family N-acetylglucosaminyl deacetylase
MSETLTSTGHKPTLTIDTKPMWDVKAGALRAHESQLLAIERYFGKQDRFPETRRYESFVLAWEQGMYWPTKSELHSRMELGLNSTMFDFLEKNLS